MDTALTFQQIMDGACQLNIGERRRLIRCLGWTLTLPEDVRISADAELPDKFVALMEELHGGPICGRGRDRELVAARMIVAFALSQRGFTTEGVGMALGRNHSTISYYQRRVREMIAFPRQYPLEVKLFKDYNELLNKHEL